MRQFQIFSLIFALFLLASCQKSDSSTDTATNINAPITPPSAAENSDTSDEDFYETFKFQTTGTCSNPSQLLFRTIVNRDEMILSGGQNGVMISAEVKLFLLKNGTYSLTYREIKANDQIAELLFEKVLNGRFVVEGKKILLSGLGVGNQLRVGQEKMILFKFQKNLSDPHLVVLPAQAMQITMGNEAPQNESADEFCN